MYFSDSQYSVLTASCQLRTQTYTSDKTDGYIFVSALLLHGGANAMRARRKQGYAIGDPCSNLKVPLDTNGLSVSVMFSCYDLLSTGYLYTVFNPDMTTTQITSSANPAYAQCLVANMSTTAFEGYVQPLNVSGDWASCLTSLATPPPTPRTFAPTTALQGEFTVGASLGPPRSA